jgi:indolepyruvate ferredoxin oxidoreductase
MMRFPKCVQAGRAVVNTHEQPTGAFAKNADWQFPLESVEHLIEESVAQG